MKRVLLYFSMLLAIGLLSACSDDDDNPFVGEWQLIEVREVDSGEIIYPSDKDEGLVRIERIEFLSNLNFSAFWKDKLEEDVLSMTYHYNENVLTVQIEHWGYYSYKYDFSENCNLLRLTSFDTNIPPGFSSSNSPLVTSTYKKIKEL